ncbi:hypothetical protein IMZ11_00735 [Microtetraspora sp. AC03309]|uniref:hypothetical protein n=1 Tax=Microtetraspora sp. AC03309 TaxID=2779376 RepID=UPI001E440463|nr:hypothetical protein [Microtetraspora sp. AC03309]MCC5574165.1 hypothetical protein [Microtetraspora sp. AC03309]
MFKRSVRFWWIIATLVSALPYVLPTLGGTGIGLCPIQGGDERYVGFDLPIFGLVYAGIGSVLPLLLLVSALATLKASPAMHRILARLGAGGALIAVAAYALHSALFITYCPSNVAGPWLPPLLFVAVAGCLVVADLARRRGMPGNDA